MRSSPGGQPRVHDRHQQKGRKQGSLVVRERPGRAQAFLTLVLSARLPNPPQPTDGSGFASVAPAAESGCSEGLLPGAVTTRTVPAIPPRPSRSLTGTWKGQRMSKEGEKREERPESSLSKEDHK